jgi:hypothetical protein
LGLEPDLGLYGEVLFNFLFSPQTTAVDIPFTTGLQFKL